MKTTRTASPAWTRRVMSPPAASDSSSGCGAKTSTRGCAGSVSGWTAGTFGPGGGAGSGGGGTAGTFGTGGTPARTQSGRSSATTRSDEAAARRARSYLVALDKASRDHQPLDLVGALADDHERRIAVVALDGEFLHVAVAAEDAHRLQAHLLARLR